MTSHCSPSSDPAAINVTSVDDGNTHHVVPASGLRRGIIVWLHGAVLGPCPVPNPLVDIASNHALTFATAQAADGWVNVSVNYPEDFHSPIGIAAAAGDIAADSAHGARYLNTVLLWWDHVVTYLERRYGSDLASHIVLLGGSWGGWHTCQIMKNRPTGIAGFITMVTACNLSHIVDGVGGVTWSTLDTSGCVVASSHLNAVTVPGLIHTYLGDGTTDAVVNVPDQVALKNAAVAAGRAITYVGLAGTHLNEPPYTSATSANPLNMTYWMANTIDPSCPKVY